MPLFDTSGTIDSSMFMKANLDHNMVGTNYYIENLQNKRNLDWEARYNVKDIEEELSKQCYYTTDVPNYTPIDVVITNVKDDKGKPLGEDWAHLAFKNLKHPCGTGYRYRFGLDVESMANMDEEEKHYSTSIWLAINKAPIRAGNSVTVRRCNTSLVFVGSPSGTRDYITEVHYEPCVLDNEMKYMQVYYNQTIPVPQAEYYVTMQLNYFSNCVKINDRFILGITNSNEDMKMRNIVYKVKAVLKGDTTHTFVKDEDDMMKSTPLVVLALDKDNVAPDDDIPNRVAESAPIYLTLEQEPEYQHYLTCINEDDAESSIVQGDEEVYKFQVLYNKKPVLDADFNITTKLNGIVAKNWSKYYEETIDTTSTPGMGIITIKNLKECKRGKLILTVKSPKYGLEQEYEIELAGFY